MTCGRNVGLGDGLETTEDVLGDELAVVLGVGVEFVTGVPPAHPEMNTRIETNARMNIRLFIFPLDEFPLQAGIFMFNIMGEVRI